MKKRLIVTLFLLVAVTSLAVAPVFATALPCRCYASGRGDWQVLSNDASGAVVRAWVISTCRFGRFVYVTVVANAASDGSLVTGAYTLWTTFGSRPVDVSIDEEIANVNRIIVTPLGAVGGF